MANSARSAHATYSDPVRSDCGPLAYGLEQQDTAASPDKIKALRKLAETTLAEGSCFSSSSRLGALTVQLQTNSYHLYEFWQENWFPGSVEDEPDCSIYVALEVERRTPSAFYGRQDSTAVIFNSDSYATCRDWALGVAAGAARAKGIVGLRAASLETGDKGVLVVCSDAAVLSAFAVSCAAFVRDVRLQNVGWCWIRQEGEQCHSVVTERAYYVPTSATRFDDRLRKYLEFANIENVVERKDNCTNLDCLERVVTGEYGCVFDSGYAVCYWSNPSGGALVPPGLWPCFQEGRRPLLLSSVVFLEPLQEEDELQTEVLSERDALAHLRAGLMAGAEVPGGFRYFYNDAEFVGEKLKGCLAAADTSVVRFASNALPEAVREFADMCSCS